jgi:hypothetical protein
MFHVYFFSGQDVGYDENELGDITEEELELQRIISESLERRPREQ